MPVTGRPDLEKRQNAWQDWRNAQYGELQNEERFVSNSRRGNNLKQGTRYAAHDNDLLSREVQTLDEQRSRYDLVVAADTAIKNGYWRGTAEQWEAALDNAEQLMRR